MHFGTGTLRRQKNWTHTSRFSHNTSLLLPKFPEDDTWLEKYSKQVNTEWAVFMSHAVPHHYGDERETMFSTMTPI